MFNPNNGQNNTLTQVASSIGSGAATIASAYTKSRKAKEEAARQADMLRRKLRAERIYQFVSTEICEVFNSVATAVEEIKPMHPLDLLLPFDGATFVDTVDSFYYRINKCQTKNDSEGVHIRTLQATVNALCLERCRSGLNPVHEPLECEVVNAPYHYDVRVFDLQNEKRDALPLKCSLGSHIGQFCYDAKLCRLYVSSNQSQPIFVGDAFQFLHTGAYTDAKLEQNGIVYAPALGRFHASKIIYRLARIAPKNL